MSSKTGMKGVVVATQYNDTKDAVEVLVELTDGNRLSIPTPTNKGRLLGVGAEVVISVSKVRKPRQAKPKKTKKAA